MLPSLWLSATWILVPSMPIWCHYNTVAGKVKSDKQKIVDPEQRFRRE